MTEIKLTHYNAKGKAETCRLILAHAGKNYEDKRITVDDMKTLKPSLPYGQLPVLEWHGATVSQSMAIARFLAHECGLAGASTLEDALIDETVDVINDFQNALYQAYFERDETVREEKKKKALEETLPTCLANLEKQVEKRGGGQFVGSTFTWAELHFYQIMEMILKDNEKVLDAFPKLKAIFNNTKEIPNIKKWLEERPKTDY